MRLVVVHEEAGGSRKMVLVLFLLQKRGWLRIHRLFCYGFSLLEGQYMVTWAYLLLGYLDVGFFNTVPPPITKFLFPDAICIFLEKRQNIARRLVHQRAEQHCMI